METTTTKTITIGETTYEFVSKGADSYGPTYTLRSHGHPRNGANRGQIVTVSRWACKDLYHMTTSSGAVSDAVLAINKATGKMEDITHRVCRPRTVEVKDARQPGGYFYYRTEMTIDGVSIGS